MPLSEKYEESEIEKDTLVPFYLDRSKPLVYGICSAIAFGSFFICVEGMIRQTISNSKLTSFIWLAYLIYALPAVAYSTQADMERALSRAEVIMFGVIVASALFLLEYGVYGQKWLDDALLLSPIMLILSVGLTWAERYKWHNNQQKRTEDPEVN